MRERGLTLLGGLLALFLVAMLLLPTPDRDNQPVSLPTTVDRGERGLAGLQRWLAQSGVPTLALQERYSTLAELPQLPDRGNLLITTLPHRLGSRQAERDDLVGWLAAGNSMLVLAPLSGRAEWSDLIDASPSEFLRTFGFHPIRDSRAPAADDQEWDDPSPAGALTDPPREPVLRTLLPSRAHPLLEGVVRVEAEGIETGLALWRLQGTTGRRSALVLLRDAEGAPALWQLRVGEGTAWVMPHTDVFGNVGLGRADNARLMANLVAAALRPGGQVIFDDMHQGLTALYDPDAFFRDPRLHHTLGFMLALWLVYLLGHTNRFVPPRSADIAPRLATEVHAIGGLFARRLQPAAAAGRLLYHFYNETRARYGLPQNGEPVWEALARNARVDARLLSELQALARRAKRGRRVDLVKLSNGIQSLRKLLS